MTNGNQSSTEASISVDMRINVINCVDCGRFIAYNDLDSGKCLAEDVWCTGVSLELSHVDYWCIKCTEKKKNGKDD